MKASKNLLNSTPQSPLKIGVLLMLTYLSRFPSKLDEALPSWFAIESGVQSMQQHENKAVIIISLIYLSLPMFTWKLNAIKHRKAWVRGLMIM